MNRNPHLSVHKEPITREQVREVRARLGVFWEDTMLVTHPSGHRIVEAGNLAAILDTLLQCNDFDNPQLTLRCDRTESL